MLSAAGMHEHVTVSFTSEAANARFPGLFDGGASVLVRNPLRADATALQRSALGALLAALEANVAVQQSRVDLFTIARTFSATSEDEAPSQREVVAGILFGARPGARPGEARKVAFADLRSVVRLSPASTLMLRGVAGSTPSGTLPAQREFPLGGVDALRAHAFGQFRGNQVALAQAEYAIGLWRLRARRMEGGLNAIAFLEGRPQNVRN